MKALKNILVVFVFAIAFTSCKSEAKPEIKTVETAAEAETAKLDPNATYAKAEFTINGMTCAMGCAKSIEKKVAKMEGVKSAKVDFSKKIAMVEFDEAKVTTASIEETVGKVGKMYEVENMKTVEKFSNEKTCDKNDKKECASKTAAEKKACMKDCEKKCCEKEEKA